MKYSLLILLLFLSALCLRGQTTATSEEGTVSFITSQNVYVKFQSTGNISKGDTLFITSQAKMIPVLIVKDLSSISCVCTPLGTNKFAISDKISTRPKIAGRGNISEVKVRPDLYPAAVKLDTGGVKKAVPKKVIQEINGRISVASYSNFSNVSNASHQLRYTFSLDARHIDNSKLSTEIYISFAHRINQWSEVKSNVFNALKIYSLAVSYDFNSNHTVWLGRRINPRLSSAGAIDGLQYDYHSKSFSVGLFGGTRPDYMNYSFNANLVQFGGYVGHDYANIVGNMQSTLAIVEQNNHGNTDRRFAYFQHTNSLIKNLYFFGSLEFDLYNKVFNKQDSTLTQHNKPILSNLYVSLRYKVFKQLSLSLSYSARQNIIYYETYKTFIERLLDASTMKGYMLQANFRPGKNISIGANAGYRFSRQDPSPAKNLYSYITFNNVPGLNASATLSATLLSTSYTNGNVYSVGLMRDLFHNKVSGGITYSYVQYKFRSDIAPLLQNVGEMNLTWRMWKKFYCALNYEGTFEKKVSYNRIFANLTQRF